MDYFKLIICMILIFILSGIDCMSIYGMNNNPSSKIMINLPSYTLEYYENNNLVKKYPIAIGKPSTPTPRGLYKIQDKEVNPCWYPPDKKGYTVPSGPDNPLGYRWMGFEFNYGIHGTNAPWSIGSAVSNGCVRMYEEDVEELFDHIQYNTPVSIVYDRINIQVDPIGQATIEIYPDIYGYDNLTVEQVKSELIGKHVGDLIEEKFLLKLIMKEKVDQQLFAKLSNVKINNKKLVEYLVWWEGMLYAPVEIMETYLDIPLEWDEDKQLIVSKQYTAPAMVRNNIVYVEVSHLPKLFNVEQKWDQDTNCLLIHAPTLLIADQFVTHDIQFIKDIPYVPIDKVAQSLGRTIDWDKESQTFWLGSRKIVVKQLGDEAYIEASKISNYFNVSIVYDETLKTINMTGFCCPMDYSMYLAEMGDCF